MKAKRYLSWVVLALLVYWIVAHPTEAAASARGLAAGLAGAAEAIATFVNALG
ncbi:hypothetical protein [Streptomonospora wellingtoniae]|uniref:Uncharacterized protein n=1 Tax=Streptomonospora wellingtoniae TaxID=3075544 RepID=A0ABU2KY18_9ACTN|nr:hypothetical protein [Streptomonospora sp. DSM 45055]MDT0303988.1 hypothetical protein [Streptomonospora sp. DSM 45055]